VMMVRKRTDLSIIPPSGLKLSLHGNKPGAAAASQKGVTPAHNAAGAARPGAPNPTTPPVMQGRRDPVPQKAKKRPEIAPSWWTARARAGEVRPGFTKAEILKVQPDDPRAPGGVFERVGGLLSEMLE
jgi:hypothetical protein